MKIIFLIFSLLFVIQTACFSQEHPDERQIQHYQEIISLYPPDLVSEFPDKIDERMFVITGFRFPRGKYLNYIHLVLSLGNNEIKSLKAELATKAKGIYHFTDSCLMTMPYNYIDFKIVKSDSLKTCETPFTLPIPNFRQWRLSFPPEFYNDATIYVLDAKKGRFLKDDNLSMYGVGLPKEWLHGYTKGVAIFKNFAIYWLEVW